MNYLERNLYEEYEGKICIDKVYKVFNYIGYCKKCYSEIKLTFTAGTLLNDTIFLYNNTHRLINIKCPSHHCKNLVIPHQGLVIFIDVLHG